PDVVPLMPRPLPVEFCFNVTSARAGSARLSERTVVMNASFILNTSGEWESSIPSTAPLLLPGGPHEALRHRLLRRRHACALVARPRAEQGQGRARAGDPVRVGA